MNTDDVQRMVSDIIVHYGLPFTVASVTDTTGGWEVIVRTSGAGTMQFTLPDGQPTRMRTVIQQRLEAQL